MVITSAVPRILISDSRQCWCRPECTLNASLDLIVKTTSTDGFRTHVDTFLNKHRCNLLLLTLEFIESLREETLRKSFFFLSLIIESYLFFVCIFYTQVQFDPNLSTTAVKPAVNLMSGVSSCTNCTFHMCC